MNYHIFELLMKDFNTWKTMAVMYTTHAVTRRKPEQKGLDGPEWDFNQSPLSYQCNTSEQHVASSSHVWYFIYLLPRLHPPQVYNKPTK